jgi:Oxidoreductase family, NAD-binding Rossmann fold
MPPETRVVIVGCGRIAGGFNDLGGRVATHAAAYREHGAALVGCCDVDRSRAEWFARRWEIAISGDDLRVVLARTEPQVVSVCTPPDGRAAVLETVFATRSVRAVLVEKPLATKAAEAEHIRDLAREAGRPTLVNYFRAFDPFYRALARDCERGRFGRFCEGTLRYYGSALANASHLLERVVAMFGPPSAVRRLGGDHAAPLFELRAGGARVVALPTDGARYSPIELDLLFETHRVRVIDSERRVEIFRSRPDPDYDGFENLEPEAGWSGGAPSHESIRHAVDETLRAAAGFPVGDEVLDRAVVVTRILEEIGAV